jgi:quinol monooxygenase YgiN
MVTMVAHRPRAYGVGACAKMIPVSEWVVVMRFVVSDAETGQFRADATSASRVLGACDGCLGIDVARASDDPAQWIVTARWASVGDYRRALSSFDVKLQAVSFLSRAIDEPTAFEVLFAVDEAGEREVSGDLAGDAGTVDRSR